MKVGRVRNTSDQIDGGQATSLRLGMGGVHWTRLCSPRGARNFARFLSQHRRWIMLRSRELLYHRIQRGYRQSSRANVAWARTRSSRASRRWVLPVLRWERILVGGQRFELSFLIMGVEINDEEKHWRSCDIVSQRCAESPRCRTSTSTSEEVQL